MLKKEIAGFLRQVPPFSLLPEAEVKGVVEQVALDYFPRGTRILHQSGEPTGHLYVVKRGGVRVFMESDASEEIVIDYRGEGEYFGLLSVVSGDRPRAHVVAVEDTLSFMVPKEWLLDALQRYPAVNEEVLKSYLLHFIDKTWEESRKKYDTAPDGDRVLFATTVGEIVRRRPVTVEIEATIRQAAQRMADRRISSLVVVDAEGLPVGIVTDRDLREKVVAQGTDSARPVSAIMSSPLITTDSEELCFEALLKMVRGNIHHLVVAESGHLKGVVTNHDFMVLQGSSPSMLVKQVAEIQSLDRLRETTPKLNRVVANLLRQGAKSHHVTGIVTELTERLLNRVVDLVTEELGPPPVPYTIFAFGEAARRELTLERRLQAGIVWEAVGDIAGEAAAREYCSRLASRLGCGVATGEGENRRCIESGDMRSLADWEEVFDLWAADGAADGATEPRVDLFDLRGIRGDLTLADRLREGLLARLAESGRLRAAVASRAMESRPPLGFFKRFVVEKGGEHRHELNLSDKGIRPLVRAVRFFALERRIDIPSSHGRLSELRAGGFEEAENIEHALDYATSLLIHEQLRQIREGLPPGDFIDPEGLAPFERKTLKEAFQLASSLSDRLEKEARGGSRGA